MSHKCGITDMPETRALIVVRLSHLTDESTSPERQLGVCTAFCEARGWTVVGIAEDLDVSASKTSPFERPALKPWLERWPEYDVIVFWRVDRLVRRVTHLASMIEWSEAHDVNLVSATEAHFDLSTGIGQALAIFVGVFAQMEAEAISDRTTMAAAHNLKLGKYTGGDVPWGYKPVRKDGEWRLEIDPPAAKQARDVIDQIIDGKLPTTVCRELNDANVPTPQDASRIARGKESMGSRWRTSNLVRTLQSPTLIGQVMAAPSVRKGGKKVYGKKELVRADDGSPLVRAEPLIDRDTWERLQAALEARKGPSKPPARTGALLLRVIECGVCGRVMYQFKGRNKYYYRCSSANYQTACGNPMVVRDEADSVVTERLLYNIGDEPRRKKVYDPGSDTGAEIAEIDGEIEDIAGLIGTGPFKDGPGRARLETRLEALSARRGLLAIQEFRPAGFKLVPTGETFAEHWKKLDQQGRNMFLRDHGIKLTVKPRHMLMDFGQLEPLRKSAQIV